VAAAERDVFADRGELIVIIRQRNGTCTSRLAFGLAMLLRKVLAYLRHGQPLGRVSL